MKKFTNARIYRQHDHASEILVDQGVIKQIGTSLPQAEEEIDLRGHLVVPPYVDAHLHLDYVYTGRSEGALNATGTLFEGIARWHDVKKTQTPEEARARALRGIQEEVSKGVQFIRTHIDVDDPKLTGLKVMLELRDQLKDNVAVQIVAFPQEGMYTYNGGDDANGPRSRARSSLPLSSPEMVREAELHPEDDEGDEDDRDDRGRAADGSWASTSALRAVGEQGAEATERVTATATPDRTWRSAERRSVLTRRATRMTTTRAASSPSPETDERVAASTGAFSRSFSAITP